MPLKMKDLRNLAIDELQEKVHHLKKELMLYRFQAKTGKLERQSAVRDTRRDIARCLTVMNAKKSEASS